MKMWLSNVVWISNRYPTADDKEMGKDKEMIRACAKQEELENQISSVFIV